MQVSSANFGGMASFGGTSEQFVKVFPVKILFSTKFIKNFSRESFPLYGIEEVVTHMSHVKALATRIKIESSDQKSL